MARGEKTRKDSCRPGEQIIVSGLGYNSIGGEAKNRLGVYSEVVQGRVHGIRYTVEQVEANENQLNLSLVS